VLSIVSVTLVFAREMQTEARAARNAAAQAEARQIARGAARAVVADLWGPLLTGGVAAPTAVPIDAERFGDGIYWILRPDTEVDTQPRFGVVGEAGRLDLNAATSDQLQGLPGVTPDVADAIVDWRDADDEPGADGAESPTYAALRPARLAKNGDFETVDELLLVRGIDALILDGEDLNRNGVLDDSENDANASGVADNRDGRLDRGLAGFVTAWGGADGGRDDDDEALLDLNQASPPELREGLGGVLSEERVAELLPRLLQGRPWSSLLAVYLQLTVTPTEQGLLNGVVVVSATGPDAQPGAAVDVFEAPAPVLNALDGMEPGDGEKLVAARAAGQAPAGTLSWVSDVLGPDKALAAAPQLRGAGSTFSADIVAISGGGRAFVRFRVVVETAAATATVPPSMVYVQDLTSRGWPLDPQIMQDLRDGVTADDVARSCDTGATTAGDAL